MRKFDVIIFAFFALLLYSIDAYGFTQLNYAKSSDSSNNFNSISVSYTPSTAPDLIIAFCIAGNTGGSALVDTVDYGTDAMTAISAGVVTNETNQGHIRAYKLTAPPSGNQTVTCSLTGSNTTKLSLYVIGYTGDGVDVVDYEEAVTASTAADITVTLTNIDGDYIAVGGGYATYGGTDWGTGTGWSIDTVNLGTRRSAFIYLNTTPVTSGATSQVCEIDANQSSSSHRHGISCLLIQESAERRRFISN